MKILRAIPVGKIPRRAPGTGDRSNSKQYDLIVQKVSKLMPNTVLPIECDTVEESIRLMHALRLRRIYPVRRRTTIYAGNGDI